MKLPRQYWKARIIRYVFMTSAAMSIVIVALVFLFLGRESWPFIQTHGIGQIFNEIWRPVSFEDEQFGMLSLITGSLLVTLLATGIAVPFGVISAIYIAGMASPGEREIWKPVIEMLAGIPSVVLGFFGLVVVAPMVKQVFHLSSGLNALTGALLLALMAIPTIITISEDAIRNVPRSYKEASFSLGASKLQTIWKVTVPAALSGIVAAVMLGLGRVVGETMAVMMVTGNAAIVTFDPTESVRTMTATVAAEMGEVPFGSDHYHALFVIGVVLLIMTFSLNMVAQRVLKKYRIG